MGLRQKQTGDIPNPAPVGRKDYERAVERLKTRADFDLDAFR